MGLKELVVEEINVTIISLTPYVPSPCLCTCLPPSSVQVFSLAFIKIYLFFRKTTLTISF